MHDPLVNKTRPPSPPASAYNGPDIISIQQSQPAETNAPCLTACQRRCFQEHRRFRVSRNVFAPVACQLCFIENDAKSHDAYGPIAADRWSCIWCALRVCSACRRKVDELYGHISSRAPTRITTPLPHPRPGSNVGFRRSAPGLDRGRVSPATSGLRESIDETPRARKRSALSVDSSVRRMTIDNVVQNTHRDRPESDTLGAGTYYPGPSQRKRYAASTDTLPIRT